MISGTVLKDEVLANLELNDVAADIDRFQIYENINKAQLDILRLFPLDQIDNAKKTAKGNLVINVPSYQWPSDFIRFIKLWVDYDSAITDTNHGASLTLNTDEFNPMSLDQRYSKVYPKYEFVEGGWSLRPVPPASIVNGYRLRYIYQLPTISASQQSLLRIDLKNAIVFGATKYSALIDGYRPELSAEFSKLFNEQLTIFSGDNRG